MPFRVQDQRKLNISQGRNYSFSIRLLWFFCEHILDSSWRGLVASVSMAISSTQCRYMVILLPRFFSKCWISHFLGGILSAILGAVLGTYIFISPHFSWTITDSCFYCSVYIFICIGVLFGLFHEWLHLTQDN